MDKVDIYCFFTKDTYLLSSFAFGWLKMLAKKWGH